MASELGWLRHTCHGALAGLKKKRGLEIISDKHASGERIYRLAAPAEGPGPPIDRHHGAGWSGRRPTTRMASKSLRSTYERAIDAR